MAKKGSHYVKQKGDKPLFTKKDIKVIGIVVIAIIVLIAAFFIYVNAVDESLKIEDGKVVGAEANWIIANSGAGDKPTYYKYAEYDFSSYDGEVVPGSVSFDNNATCVELFPADGRYNSAYIYASGKDAETIARNVTSQIGGILTEGTVHPYEDFNGGYICWYTTREDRSVSEDSDETEAVYLQVFTAYMPAVNNGTAIIRLNYEFASPEEYVDAETGYAEVATLLEGIEY